MGYSNNPNLANARGVLVRYSDDLEKVSAAKSFASIGDDFLGGVGDGIMIVKASPTNSR